MTHRFAPLEPSAHAPVLPLRHAVVIATVGRWPLLARALRSVEAQTRSPDRIVVVVDGDASATLPTLGIDVAIELLHNRRTRGAAGAWNTGIDHLARNEASPGGVVVSFLDDDDWWDADHLAAVHDRAVSGAEIVASPIVRYDEKSPDGKLAAAPDALRAGDFLTGNPGVQGSNLSACLRTVLEAGGFDESLRSATDRDLCIRLADLGASYAAARGGAAHHDTLHGGPRLSDPGSPQKHAGLDAFFAKYRFRMSVAERAAAEARALALFGWAPKEPAPCPPHTARVPRTDGPLPLVVGVIVDGSNSARALPLLDGLARLRGHRRVTRLDLVLLENGAAEGFERVVTRGVDLGIPVWPARLAAQREVAADVGLDEAEVTAQKSIAAARSLLHRFAFEVARIGEPPVVWILDDDSRIVGDLDLLVDDVVRAREGGVDVLIGRVIGAPPIPAAAAVRGQLVDLHGLLQGAGRRAPDEPPPDAGPHNRALREGRRDYYHDLARSETDRQETPFLPEATAPTLGETVAAVLGRSARILAGEQIFRPIPAPGDDPIAAAEPSSLRGGNTFVFDLDLLRDVPNLSPRLAGRRLRRSDMIWAAVSRIARGKRVVAAPAVVEHDRSSDPIDATAPTKLLDDLVGYAFFRAFEEGLAARRDPSAPLAAGERLGIRARMRKYAIERLAAYRLSFHRVRGLVRSFERMLATAGPEEPWWLSHAASRDALAELVAHLQKGFTPEALRAVEARVEEQLADAAVDAFLEAIGAAFGGPPAPRGPAWDAWLAEARAAHARALCARVTCGAIDEVLGMGAEGVVVRAGDRVLKVFDGWSAADRAAHTGKLHRLASAPVEPALPRVLGVHELPEALVLETAFEPSRPYEGGEGPLLVALLRALREAGWVHENLHPKNLRVTARGITIVDVGRSLAPATPDGEAHMARRAMLCFRFAWRRDLAALMRRSIDETDFPELVGWQHLLAAAGPGSPKRRLDAEIAAMIEARAPASILDYGCGKPRDMPALAAGRRMVVFDPDASMRPRWADAAPGLVFVDEGELLSRLVGGETFDVVLCSLVLCAVGDDDVRIALERIRRLVAPTGRVFVAVCDPTSHLVRATTYQRRLGAGAIPYEGRGTYEKRVEGTARVRVEHHRPLTAYRRAFARAGLAVVAERTIDGIDVERFERVAEFIVFELRPLPAIGPRTSLLVKACALEAETIGDQVQHIVQQLGAPRAFDEVVLLLDTFEGPFPREHRRGDLSRLRAEAQALVDRGLVDRVLEGPRDGEEARALAARWFGVDGHAAHSDNGQPALGILDAIERCDGELVFHADADLMVARPDPAFDPIADAALVFDADPAAVTLSLPVFADTEPVTRSGDARGPFRIDACAGWIHRGRLCALAPLPNTLHNGRPALPWHRALDQVIRQGKARSLRRGSPSIWCAWPDNARKYEVDRHMLLLGRVEDGHAPPRQAGRAEVQGPLVDWLGPKRHEPVVVVICGRNVSPGRVPRCLDSLTVQRGVSWGAVVIDDASSEAAGEVLRRAVAALGASVTYVRQRRRVGLLANTALAVRDVCDDPDSIVVLLDLDDALGAADALETVARAHASGADVTVGSMVRTDKDTAYPVDFTDPRGRRGGNVWQHLRTFRKALFDRVELRDLKLDGGFVDPPSDWAMMVPIVEMASRPVWIRRPLYLHEPSGPRTPDARAEREAILARVLARPSYRSPARAERLQPRSLTVLCYHRIADGEVGVAGVYRRRGMAVSRRTFEAQARALARRFEPVGLRDLQAAALGARALPEKAALVTFDDGYRDLVEVALPILERVGIPAIAFARAAGPLGLPSWAPLDLLYHVLAAACPEAAELPDASAREELLALSHAEQTARVLAIARKAGVATDGLRPQDLYLSADALRALPSAGVALGAHGVDHVRWTTLSDELLTRAAAESAAWLRSLSPGAPLTLAYPDAAYDEREARAAAEAGFSLAFGLAAAPLGVPDRLGIRRWIAQDDPMWIEALTASVEAEAP